MYRKYVTIWSLILGASIGVSLASVRSSYGEECSKLQKCDRKGWLGCQEGICRCVKVDEMHYDETKKKCVTKSGERCKYGVEVEEGIGENTLFEVTECVPNARCAPDGLCVCDTKYHEIFNGTCVLSSTFGEVCAENHECSNAEHLNCLEGICGCKEGSIYSPDESQCVGLLHEKCINGKCLAGAECSADGKCSCDSDHYENGGTCSQRKGIRESCNEDIECIHKGLFRLKCKSGACECDDGLKYSTVQKTEYYIHPGYENYNNVQWNYIIFSLRGASVELCAPLVGEDCPDGYCVPNAQCLVPEERRLSNDKYKYAKCECLPGFSSDKDFSKCGKTANNQCSTNFDCANNLVCNERICRCPSPEHQTVHDDRKSCFSLIGGRCTRHQENSTLDCVENSNCHLSWSRLTGHCKCNPGFVENKLGRCDGEFGTSCNYGSNFCDKASNLICLNNKCSCPDDMYTYSSDVRKCLGLVGAKCKENNDCVENADCISSHPLIPSRCKCKSTYVESENSTCQDLFLD